jgi:tetratricopeptide (TPR) repeat protein
MPLQAALDLAARHLREGRAGEAEALCREILRARPKNAPALHLLGVAAHARGDLEAAIKLTRRAIAADGRNVLYHANLVELCRQAGRLDDALAAGRRALALDPQCAQALNNLGIVRYERREYETAIGLYRRAVAALPSYAEAHSNLGNALRIEHRFDEAVAAYDRALALEPRYVDAVANRASALHLSGRLDEAAAAFRQALALDPNHANAHSGLGLLLLLEGRFAEGWPEYEWRWRSSEARPLGLSGREWQGEPLAGRRILVQAEQGLGDTIQFCRYLPELKARGAEVGVAVQPALAGLLCGSFPWARFIAADERWAYDCFSTMLSLPWRVGTVRETIPGAVPYLAVAPAARQRWAERLGSAAALKVGLVWAGNPGHVNDRKRSLEVETLAPLLAVPGTRFFALQVGARAADLGRLAADAVEDLAPALGDFAETAAAVANLDLVIAVDTSVAHLAGALGRPVWVLLSAVPDWRWLKAREDSPWYPSLRLFRQGRLGDWEPVIARVAEVLARASFDYASLRSG